MHRRARTRQPASRETCRVIRWFVIAMYLNPDTNQLHEPPRPPFEPLELPSLVFMTLGTHASQQPESREIACMLSIAGSRADIDQDAIVHIGIRDTYAC